jgi:pimeloyl-ACP methyl ester carboxylesterase
VNSESNRFFKEANSYPLILIHGYNSNWTNWVDLLAKLTGVDLELFAAKKDFLTIMDEFSPIRLVGLKIPYSDVLKKGAAAIIKYVQNIVKPYGIYLFDYSLLTSFGSHESPKILGELLSIFFTENNLDSQGYSVNIIAHSMGGLVAREAVEFHNLRLKGLVMLATPNHCSPMAWAKWELDQTMERAEIPWVPDPAVTYMTFEITTLNQPGHVAMLFKNIVQLAVFTAYGDITVPTGWVNCAKIPSAPPNSYLYQEFHVSHKSAWAGIYNTHNSMDNSNQVLQATFDFLYGPSPSHQKLGLWD